MPVSPRFLRSVGGARAILALLLAAGGVAGWPAARTAPSAQAQAPVPVPPPPAPPAPPDSALPEPTPPPPQSEAPPVAQPAPPLFPPGGVQTPLGPSGAVRQDKRNDPNARRGRLGGLGQVGRAGRGANLLYERAAEDPLEVRVAYRRAKTQALLDPRFAELTRAAEQAPDDEQKRAYLRTYYLALFDQIRKIDPSRPMARHLRTLAFAAEVRYAPRRTLYDKTHFGNARRRTE